MFESKESQQDLFKTPKRVLTRNERKRKLLRELVLQYFGETFSKSTHATVDIAAIRLAMDAAFEVGEEDAYNFLTKSGDIVG